LLAYTAAWSEVVSDIPDGWLDACYAVAIKKHNGRSPFGAAEIAQAWPTVQAGDDYKRWRERELRSSQGRWEHGCDGGWIFVDPSGDKGGVRPCPVHRAGFARRVQEGGLEE
jgi:hypothetical protein